MQETTNKVGRPPLYQTAEDLQAVIDDYFLNGVRKVDVLYGTAKDGVHKEPIPTPTITGLVLHLGFASRQSFYDLEKQDKFSYTIKRARTRIEMIYEEQLQRSGGSGPIFALKNFGWIDNQEITNLNFNKNDKMDKDEKEEIKKRLMRKLNDN